MTWFRPFLEELAENLDRLGASWAVVGGLAVSMRGKPRSTVDIDLAISVESDTAAIALTRALGVRGFRVEPWQLEHEPTGRLATTRLRASLPEAGSPLVDLMFASSGLEPEIVAAAEKLEILPGLRVPVARAGHLLAMKILANRRQDQADAVALVQMIEEIELRRAEDSLRLIEERGFSRGAPLAARLAAIVAEAGVEQASSGFVQRPSFVQTTHANVDSTLCGRPTALADGTATVELLTTPAMAADDRGLVHGGFVFGAADYAAMLAVNDPNVVLAGAETRFLRPVRVGETVVARATVESSEGRKRRVTVEVTRGADVVMTGTFLCAVLDRHVLDL